MANKQYASPEAYEAKLEKVMARLGVESYDYDWSRRECYVSFTYKGVLYRFEHGIENAQAHGVNLKYGSDAFAQLILSLEDLARMVERGIYDLSTWVAGMKYLPAPAAIEPCFLALGFSVMPCSTEEVRKRFKLMSKSMHPDAGGDVDAFQALTENYEACLRTMEDNNG